MLTRFLIIAALVCAFAGAPVHSLPGVTLTLEKVTLHEALLKLSEQTNWRLSGPAGEGRIDGVDPAKALKSRASFQWKNASLSTACRDIAKAYGLVALEDGFHTIYFKRGPKPAALIAAIQIPGATIGVSEIARLEEYLLTAGSPKPQLQVNTRMTIAVRPNDGDPDRVASVEFLTATDDLGLAIPVGRMHFQPLSFEERYGPGEPVPVAEWVGAEDLLVIDPRAKKLVWLKGEIRFYEHIKRSRVEIPVSGTAFPVEKRIGPLTIVAQHLQITPGDELGILTGKVRLAWSNSSGSESVITDDATDEWPAPNIRLRSGTLVSLAAFEVEEQCGVETCELIIKQRVRSDDPPVALVWDLVHRSDPGPPIPYTLKNVPLPSGTYETLIGPTPPRKAPPVPRPASRPNARR